MPRLARPLRLLLLLGTPLVTGAVGFFHPTFLTPESAAWWTTLHVLQLPLFGLLGLCLYVLAGEIAATWRVAVRLLAGVFAVFYGAFDSIVGIATGSVQMAKPRLTAAQQDGAEAAIQVLFRSIGNSLIADIGKYAWLIAVVALSVALARRGRSVPPLALLVAGAVSFWVTHEFPSGALGMGAVFLAVLWLELGPRNRAAAPREEAAGLPARA